MNHFSNNQYLRIALHPPLSAGKTICNSCFHRDSRFQARQLELENRWRELTTPIIEEWLENAPSVPSGFSPQEEKPDYIDFVDGRTSYWEIISESEAIERCQHLSQMPFNQKEPATLLPGYNIFWRRMIDNDQNKFIDIHGTLYKDAIGNYVMHWQSGHKGYHSND